jgi:hypothetical protein
MVRLKLWNRAQHALNNGYIALEMQHSREPLEETPFAPERIIGGSKMSRIVEIGTALACPYHTNDNVCRHDGGIDICNEPDYVFPENCPLSIIGAAPLKSEESASSASQSDEIIADIKEVVRSWFKCNDNLYLLTHRECDILNSVVKCYKRR